MTPIMSRIVFKPEFGSVSIAAVRYLADMNGGPCTEGGICYQAEGRGLVVDGVLYTEHLASIPRCFRQPREWPRDVIEAVQRLLPENYEEQPYRER